MAGDPAFACKGGAGNAHPKVGAHAFCIRAHVARMGGAFVQHFELGGRQPGLELLLDVCGARWQGLV